ncbi:MFS transporter [Bacillus sp. FJAT-49736]|uniref:MDR family MFS transporter n=1 Tax=Bacillus sp. FJAT-49736 TaxID=2833582 RepID=UPI001BC905C1|nr:MFS transporter [Bacillus sp. FJAT-49736]MBS4174456.1 MFS transporter [Bacillus sp. FJAT-49736]MBS4175813.1 MFS transporter [Bacillus sp. FJAT-49736]
MKQILSNLKEYHPIVHLLMLGTVFSSLTNSISLVFLPIYLMNSAHIGPVMIGVIVGAGALTATIGGFLGGTLSDFLGRNRLMLFSLLILGAVFSGFLLTSNSVLLCLLNILRGLFSSFFVTISKALLADLTPKEKRFRLFSNRYMGGNIGYAIGPIIGTYFGIAGNKTAFLFTSIIYVGYFLVMGLLLRYKNTSSNVGDENEEKVMLAEAWRVFSKDKVLLLFICGSILLTAVHGEMSVTLSQYLNKAMPYHGMELFGYLMSINGITVIVTQVLITRWSERFGLFNRIALGSLLFALGEIGFAFSQGSLGFILAMVIFTFGEILIIPSEYAQLDEITPNGMRGMYYGAQGFSDLGNFIGPWLGGVLLSSYGGRTMFLTFALISICSIGFYAWGRNLYSRQSQQVTHYKK